MLRSKILDSSRYIRHWTLIRVLVRMGIREALHIFAHAYMSTILMKGLLSFTAKIDDFDMLILAIII